LYIATAVAAFAVAVAVRFICINSNCDTGTANLVFITVFVEAVLYLVLIKTIINQVDKFVALWENKKKTKDVPTENAVLVEESVHDRIVRERFEQAIRVFCKYIQKSLDRYAPVEELKKLNDYVELFAREQSYDNVEPVLISSRHISNNDLYHYGWNLWNHFKGHRQDQRQEYVVSWLKTVFDILSEVEFSTIKGKLTIHDSKSKITRQKSIPDYLRFLKE
jgi:hypothetical protein